jgi:hypothetical protein
MPSETIHLEGHVIDSLTLSKVLDILSSYEGVRYEVRHAKIGHTREEPSKFDILVEADTDDLLERVLEEVQRHGAFFSHEDARLEPAPKDGVFPEDFLLHHELGDLCARASPLDSCGEYRDGLRGARVARRRAVARGDRADGAGQAGRPNCRRARGHPRHAPRTARPDLRVRVHGQRGLVREAQRARRARRRRRGAQSQSARRNRCCSLADPPSSTQAQDPTWSSSSATAGSMCCLRATRSLRTTSNRRFYGTSLGVSLDLGSPVTHGHQHHIRAINRIRLLGGICQAVEQGVLTRGVMYTCVKHGVPFVLAGSIRDDGPLARGDYRCAGRAGCDASAHSRRRRRDYGRHHAALGRNGQHAPRIGARLLCGQRRRHRDQARRPRHASDLPHRHRLPLLYEGAGAPSGGAVSEGVARAA